MAQTTEGFHRSASNTKIKPQYKGYVRSGQLLFNNFGQTNTWDAELPKAQNSSPRLKEALQSDKKNNVNKSTDGMPGGPDSPVKHKDYIQKTIDTALQYSPDYKLKKINHYDNTVKNIPRAVLEKYELSKVYQRDHRGLS